MKSIDAVEVHSIDETVMQFYFDENDNKIGAFGLSVESAEELVKDLQEAIEKCKKSKYYEPKGE